MTERRYLLQVICHTSFSGVPVFPHGIHGSFATRAGAEEAEKNLRTSAERLRAMIDTYIIED